ncbi:ABC transporter substrate-binding protein [Corynebacterium heidelbergense]|uniref:ABC transporter substrate-binding protein n=1 Tax=Corynebacterium heidelbergense TaxID=2055947 RepID=A0A364VAD1_9CORY|nr:ABC transporter substrate-binding protein [Corynebacterium heidelbergense]RAV33620.1 ABC transporter substrate-binding protein [Corynebacterium heidelbergense]WCZ35768.1 Putative osmoprotectant uptake system substrate-binding protein OsmF precursor [Corynebacterium heidelbergense]
MRITPRTHTSHTAGVANRAPHSGAETGQARGKALRSLSLSAAIFLLAGSAAACGNNDPLQENTQNDASTVTVGSANFPESQIIAELYSQAIADEGVETKINGGIGARDVYLSALEKGDIDIVPEYTGNLAQYYAKNAGKQDLLAPGATAQQVEDAVRQVLPQKLEAGKPAEAESKDAYRVTKETADKYGLVSLGDLAKMSQSTNINIGGNPELAQRPYGPEGLSSVYGIDKGKLKVTPISDGGGPLTVAALQDKTVQVADIYSTSPVLDRDGNKVDVVTLQDPKNLILAQNVLPVMRQGGLDDRARKAITEVQEKLTTEDLLAMNERNVGKEKAEPSKIAKDWLEEKGLTK